MGSVYYKKNEYDKAIECYKKTIELDANYVNGWFGMAMNILIIKNLKKL